MKKILALSASVVMLLSFTLQAEAGFNLGGIANKIANKAVDSAMNSGSKKTDSSAAKKKSVQMQLRQSRALKLPELRLMVLCRLLFMASLIHCLLMRLRSARIGLITVPTFM